MAKILVIDDSESFRRKIKLPLEAIGHEIVEAADGAYGLEELQKHPDFALIFCDLNMPRIDGMAFCKEVSKNSSYAGIPIIVLTTESSPQLRQEAKAYGVKAWIIKPFDEQKLLAGVSLLLEKKKA